MTYSKTPRIISAVCGVLALILISVSGASLSNERSVLAHVYWMKYESRHPPNGVYVVHSVNLSLGFTLTNELYAQPTGAIEGEEGYRVPCPNAAHNCQCSLTKMELGHGACLVVNKAVWLCSMIGFGSHVCWGWGGFTTKATVGACREIVAQR
jgi:hypothetical protein